MEQTISDLVSNTFGEPPLSIEEIKDKGQVNLVYLISLAQHKYVLRMKNSADALAIYEKGKWCVDTVRQSGVPTPESFAVGMKNDFAYSFQEYILGNNGKDVPHERERIWRTLGEYAKKINTISAPQYKRDPDILEQKLFKNDFLAVNGILPKEKIPQLRARLEQIRGWSDTTMLCHANLNPSNTVVHPSGTIYLIDWDTASGNRAPHEELADLLAWNTGKENIKLFIDGYGITQTKLASMIHDIQTLILARMLNILHYRVQGATLRRDPEFVHSLTLRLNTIEDFNADILFTKNISD